MYSFKGSWDLVYKKILRTIKTEGIVLGKSKLITNLSFEIDSKNSLLFSSKNWKWAFTELYDRLNSNYKNPGISYKFRPHWSRKLSKEGGNFIYSYNERFGDQISQVIKLLDKQKYSKQAIISVYNNTDLFDGLYYGNRVPCTLNLQFFRDSKDNILNLTAFMRTNDVINLLIYDVFHHIMLLYYISSALELFPGKYYHVSTIAYYQKKREVVGYIDKVLSNSLDIQFIPFTPSFKEEMDKAISSISKSELTEITFNNDFISDFYNVLKSLLYNQTNIEFKLDFTKRFMEK